MPTNNLSTIKAKDDLFLSSSTGLTEDSRSVVFLDVRMNDSGGNAVQLYSLDDSAPVGNNSDLTVKDTARSEATTLDRSAHGAKIWITTDGKVGYDITTADASFKASLQALNVGQFATDTFTYAVLTGNGSISWATVTVQIAGVNDAAVLSFDVKNVTEGNTAAAISTSGTLTISDVDSPATFVAQTGTVGLYGTFAINAAGAWTYTASSAHNEFAAGSIHTDTFSVRSADNTMTSVTVKILGTNDAAVITGVGSAALTETNAAQSTSGQLSATDVDSSAKFNVLNNVAGSNGYGKFSIDSTGHWTYAMNNAHNEFAAGVNYTDSINAVTSDGTTRTITVTIHGTNDAAVLSSQTVGFIETNAVFSTGGTLSISDIDNPATFVAQPGTAGLYGTFTINAAGAWTYTASSAHNEFAAGSIHTDTFSVASSDGTLTSVRVVILGTNDAAVLSADIRNLTESNVAADISTSGTLTISDADSPATFVAQSGTVGLYGTFAINAAGAWTYTASSAHNEFVGGTTYTDTFSVRSADNTMTSVTVKILGTNDAAVITGVDSAALTETDAVPPSVGGTLAATDVDSSAQFNVLNNVAGINGYGKFSIDSTGHWTYTMNGAHNEFAAGVDYIDSINATTADGTIRTITVTIHGTNDAAVLSPQTVNLTETDAVLSTGGTLSISDIDSPATFVPQAGNVGLYGTFAINAAGEWTYVANTAHNEFIAGSTHTDTFNVASSDGTPTSVTINIIGTNDAAILSSAVVPLTETDAVLSTGGTLSISDVDSPALFVAQTNAAGTYGIFSINAAGEWTYVANTAHNEFAAGSTYTDTFNVASSDGTLTSVTVNILGTNDAAVITGIDSAALTETNAAQSTSGQLSATDVDSSATFNVLSNAAGSNGFGTFSMNASGLWTYTMNSAHDEFVGGTNYTDSVQVTTADGTARTITVNILGTNDAAVITGANTAALTETNAAQSTSGQLFATDVDNSATFNVLSNAAGSNGFGTFSINASGLWTYTMNSAHDEFVGGANYTDSVQVTTADGTARTITVNILGANDAAVITGANTAALTETNAAQSTSGQLFATDVDNSATFNVLSNAAGSNGFGTFSMNASGLWTYTMNSAHDEFVGGANYTDSVQVTTADGTARTITVNILGTNDAAVITGIDSAALTETNAAQSTSGQLSATDVDSSATFNVLNNVTGSNHYGTFSMDASGNWTYTMNSAHDEFVGGTNYTDSVQVTTADGTARTLTVNILGTNDAAVLSPPQTVNLTETNAVLSTNGTLTVSDVDSPATFVPQTGNMGLGLYGTFVIDSAGAWTYTASSAHSEFAAGTTYTDTFNVASSDGTLTSVIINIAGINDITLAPPTLTLTTHSLDSQANLPLSLNGDISITLPSEPSGTTAFVTISGVPADAIFNQGTNNFNGTWTFTSDQLTGLVFKPTIADQGTVNLSVKATASNNGVDSTSAAQSLSIVVGQPAVWDFHNTENGTLVDGKLPYLGTNSADFSTYILVTPPNENGSFNWNNVNQGLIQYTPSGHFTGMESFTYAVHDNITNTTSAPATVDIFVAPTAPGHATQSFSTAENTALSGIQLLSQETSNNANDTVTYHLVTQAAGGSVSLNASGIFSYIPNANFFGTDSFIYTVTDTSQDGSTYATSAVIASITVVAPNTPPVARTVNDTENGALNTFLPYLGANSGHFSTYVLLTPPNEGGTFQWVNPNQGLFFYTPASNFTGTESFTYDVFDNVTHITSAPGTIHIVIAPTAPGHATQNYMDSAENTPLNNIQLPSQETSNNQNDTLIYNLVTQAIDGTVSLDNTTGIFSYVPFINFSGTDSFTYTVTEVSQDGTVSTTSAITTVDIVVPANVPTPDMPGNVTQNYLDFTDSALTMTVPTQESSGGKNTGATFVYNLGTTTADGTLSWDSHTGNFTYAPNANFAGDDHFTYTITATASDGNTQVTSNITTANIQVMRSDTEGGQLSTVLPQLPFVTSHAGDTFSYALVGTGTTTHSGSVVVNTNGSFTYTPSYDNTTHAGFTGEDSFTYVVTDTTNSLTSGPVNYYVGVTPTAPIVTNPSPYSASEGRQTAVFQLGFQQTSNAGDSFTYTLTTLTGDSATVQIFPNSSVEAETLANGILTFVPSGAGAGSFYYTPTTTTFTGTEYFYYTVTDHSADGTTSTTSNVAAVSIAIAPSQPGFNNENYLDSENTPLSSALDPQQTSNAGDSFTYALVHNAAHGSVTLNPDGTFSYTPNTDFRGNDSFIYTVTDHSADGTTSSTSNNVTATIAVAPSAPGNASQFSMVIPNGVLNGVLPTQGTSGDPSSDFNFQLVLGSGDINLSPAGTPIYAMQTPHGVVSLEGDGDDGHFVYTPTSGFVGTDSFSYTVTDSVGGAATSTSVTTENIDVNYGLYVLSSHSISVMDESMINTAVIAGGLPAHNSPLGITLTSGTNFNFITEALNPDNGNVYALDSSNHAISVVNSATYGGVQATIQVGNDPTNIVFNPFNHNFYVYNTADASVSVINPNSNTVITTITGLGSTHTPLGGVSASDAMVVDPINGNMYVIQNSNGLVAAINSNNVITSTLGTVNADAEARAMVFNPDNQQLYVLNTIPQADGGGSEIDIYNPTTNQRIGSIHQNFEYTSIMYDSFHHQMDMIGTDTSHTAPLFAAFSTATNTLVGSPFTIGTSTNAGMVYDSHNHYTYTFSDNNATGLNEIYVVDGGTIVSNFNIASSISNITGISFDAAANQIDVFGVYTPSSGGGGVLIGGGGSVSAMAVIDDSTNQVVSVLPTGSIPLDVLGNFAAASQLSPTLALSQVSNQTYNANQLDSGYLANPVDVISYQNDSADSTLTLTYNSQTKTGTVHADLANTTGFTDTISNFEVVYGGSHNNTFVLQGLPNNVTFGGQTGNNTADFSNVIIPANDVLHIDLLADLAYVTANGSAIGIPDKLLNFNHVVGSASNDLIKVESLANVVNGGGGSNDVIDLSALTGSVNSINIANWTQVEGLELSQSMALSLTPNDVAYISPNGQLAITAPAHNNDSVTTTGGWTATGQQTTAPDVTTGTMHTYDVYTANAFGGGAETLLIDHNITTLNIH